MSSSCATLAPDHPTPLPIPCSPVLDQQVKKAFSINGEWRSWERFLEGTYHKPISLPWENTSSYQQACWCYKSHNRWGIISKRLIHDNCRGIMSCMRWACIFEIYVSNVAQWVPLVLLVPTWMWSNIHQASTNCRRYSPNDKPSRVIQCCSQA